MQQWKEKWFVAILYKFDREVHNHINNEQKSRIHHSFWFILFFLPYLCSSFYCIALWIVFGNFAISFRNIGNYFGLAYAYVLFMFMYDARLIITILLSAIHSFGSHVSHDLHHQTWFAIHRHIFTFWLVNVCSWR